MTRLKGLPVELATTLDNLMVVAGVIHILIGLVFMAMAADFNGGLSGSAVFGKESSGPLEKQREKAREEKRKKIRPISPPAVVAYCAFTVVIWGVWFARRRRMSDRQLRFLVLFYSFGTLMAFYSIGQWIFVG